MHARMASYFSSGSGDNSLGSGMELLNSEDIGVIFVVCLLFVSSVFFFFCCFFIFQEKNVQCSELNTTTKWKMSP